MDQIIGKLVDTHANQQNEILKKYIYKYLKKVYNRNREEWDTNVWETLSVY